MNERTSSASPARRGTLTRAAVIAAAGRLLDEHGRDGWSMRTLADALSVSVSTLYWHVPGKQQLLELLIDEALSRIEIPETGPWQARLRSFLWQGRTVLRDRPAMIRLIWSAGWALGPQTLGVVDRVIGLVAASGVPDAEVADDYFTLVAFLFGFVAMETWSEDTPAFAAGDADAATFPNLEKYRPAADRAGMDRRFERGVERLLASLTRGA